MTYRLQHNLEIGEEIEMFNTLNEVKTRFLILTDELTDMPDCEAWNSENMDENDEINEDLCCGLCSMCSIVSENDEQEINNENNFILYFSNDQHQILVKKIIENFNEIP